MSLEISYGGVYDVLLTLTSDLPAFPGQPGMTLEPVHPIAKGGLANVSKVVLES